MIARQEHSTTPLQLVGQAANMPTAGGPYRPDTTSSRLPPRSGAMYRPLVSNSH
jgi:hypothetical protein